MHLAGTRKGGDDPFAPGHHDVAPVVGHRGFELRESRGHQVGNPASHAEARNAQGGALDGVVVLQEVHRGLHISDDLQVLELPDRPLHTWPQAMVEIGCYGG
jgi:hypothetical protein